MNIIRRTFLEYSRTIRILSASGRFELLLKSILTTPNILKSGKLVPVDRAMQNNYHITYYDKKLCIPVKEIDDLLSGTGDSPTFGVIREMFAANVYLRAFKNIRSTNVIDLGSNRGFFLLIANKIMDSKLAIGVEPLEKYNSVFELICRKNNIDQSLVKRNINLIGSSISDNTVSIDYLIEKYQLSSIDFLKCDIEGAEFDLLNTNAFWIKDCKNIAMEVHQG